MNLEWDFTAEAYLDQLPSQERARVVHAVERLPLTWASLDKTQLQKLTGSQGDLFSLRVGADLRILVRRRDDTITVVDVVRRSQVEGLRKLSGQGQTVAG